VEGSRERLGVEAIDLYQIHWPVPEEEIEEGWSTLAELKERGVVRPEQVDPIVAAANLTLDKHDIATLLRRK
jgi:aryl-alcohol dehydrogenase-like predicted oxidoreductase